MFKLRIITFGLGLSTAACEGCSEWQVIDTVALAPRPPYFAPNVAAAYDNASLIYTHNFAHLKASRFALPWTVPDTIGPQTHYLHTHALTIGGDGVTTTLFTSAGAMSWSRFDGGAWTAPATLDSSGHRPSVAADGTGNVLGVWVSGDAVRASRYVIGSGWSSTETLSHGALQLRSLGVAVNPSGVGVAAWCEERLDGSHIVARRFEPASGWSKSADLGSVPECARSAPTFEYLRERSTVVCGISDAGVPTVLWTDGDIKLRRQTLLPSPTWTLPVSLTSSGRALNPRLAVNGGNDAIVAWQYDGPGEVLLRARGFSSRDGTWGATSIISPHRFRSPELAASIDDAGRGMVAFIEDGSAVTVRYDGAAFQPSEVVGVRGDYELDLAMNRAGTAYLVRAWAQRDVLVHTFFP